VRARLEVLKAELDALEAADAYDAPQYDWLFSEVDKLEAEEKAAKPSAPQSTPTGEPEADLAARMLAMQASPHKYTDDQRAAILREYNAAVADAGQSQPEATDLQALQRDMLQAGADPAMLDDAGRDALLARYNKASAGRPRSAVALRADLGSQDLGTRLEAAAELQRRGEELPEGLVDRLTGEDFTQWQTERIAASRDPANLPEPLREAAKVLYAAEEAMNRPADPVAAAIGDLNSYVRGMRPPTPEEQLAELGVEPEPVSTSTTSEEA
jgi:hypothetical protein